MKRILAGLIASITVFATVMLEFPLPVLASMVDIAILPSTQTASVGDIFSVTVQVTAGTQEVDNVGSYINFSTAYVKAVDGSGNVVATTQDDLIQMGSVTSTSLTFKNKNRVDNTNGYADASYGMVSGGTPATGTFTFCTIRFKAMAEIASTDLVFSTVVGRKTQIVRNGVPVTGTKTNASVAINATDTTRPTVLTATPTGNSVALTSPVVVTFSEAMNTGTAEPAFSISPDVTGGSFSWNSPTNTVMTWSHSTAFAYKQAYTVTISTAAQDASSQHNTMDPQFQQSFTTIPQPPGVTTNAATDVTCTTATINGHLDSKGTASTVEVSFDYGNASYDKGNVVPTVHTLSALVDFSVGVTGLAPSTTYHVRANAAGDGLTNGNDVTFTTKDPPSVTTGTATQSPSQITTGTVVLNGTLNNYGSASGAQVQFEYGPDAQHYNQTTPLVTATGVGASGAFSANITVTPGSSVAFRAKAVTIYGSATGSDGNFLAGSLGAPVVTTLQLSPSVVGINSATLSGHLSSTGTAANVTVFIEYGTVASGTYGTPVAANPDHFSFGGSGDFSVTTSGLTPNTEYHFRAVAIGDGTVRGDPVNFTTLAGPYVVSHTPTATTGVDPGTPIVIVFSDAMDHTSTEGAFSMTSAAGAVSGSLAWSNSDRTLTFTPGAPLAQVTQYTVTVTVAATDASASHNHITSQHQFAFTTADTIKPTISSAVPGNGATLIETNATFVVTFSEAMNKSSAEGAFSIDPTVGGGSFAWSSGDTIMTWSHSTAFLYNQQYTVTVSTAAQDVAGNGMAADRTFTFTTRPAPLAVRTDEATVTGATTATLAGTITGTGGNADIAVWFEWGDANYGHTTAETTVHGTTQFTASIGTLTAGGTYHFKAHARAGGVTVDGSDAQFVMPAVAVIRHAPAAVSKGQQFEVTVTFTAPQNDFFAIGLHEFAPAGWAVVVNKTWCTPAANQQNIVEDTNEVQYMWYGGDGDYLQGTSFTAKYKVTVPDDAQPGVYDFRASTLRYSYPTSGPYSVPVIGATKVTVVEGATIQGVVYVANGPTRIDTGTGLTVPNIVAGATVTIDGAISVTTGTDGSFTIIATTTGTHTLVATCTGYKDQSMDVTVNAITDTITADFKGNYGMMPKAVSMDFVLDCVVKWKYPGTDGFGVGMDKVLDAVVSWKYPQY